MKMWAEFYTLSTGYIQGTIPPVFSPDHAKPIPACGDRGVLVLDARSHYFDHIPSCKDWMNKHGYIGFKIHKSGRFTEQNPIYSTSNLK